MEEDCRSYDSPSPPNPEELPVVGDGKTFAQLMSEQVCGDKNRIQYLYLSIGIKNVWYTQGYIILHRNHFWKIAPFHSVFEIK